VASLCGLKKYSSRDARFGSEISKVEGSSTDAAVASKGLAEKKPAISISTIGNASGVKS